MIPGRSVLEHEQRQTNRPQLQALTSLTSASAAARLEFGILTAANFHRKSRFFRSLLGCNVMGLREYAR